MNDLCPGVIAADPRLHGYGLDELVQIIEDVGSVPASMGRDTSSRGGAEGARRRDAESKRRRAPRRWDLPAGSASSELPADLAGGVLGRVHVHVQEVLLEVLEER